MPFKKGEVSNPRGRPKGSTDHRKKLLKAIRKVEVEKNLDVLEHAVRVAYEDNKVLIALLKKLVPDMKYVETDVNRIEDVLKVLHGNPGSNS